jgi:outer membrane protein assembly factor BamB
MNYRLARILIVTVVSAAGLTGFRHLLVHDPTSDLTLHVPGMDGRPAEPSAAGTGVRIGEFFQPSKGSPSSLTVRWPRFRGEAMDNTSGESIPLASSFGPGEPPRLWSVELGEGHAGAAVANGRVYVLDYDERRQADTLRCLSLDDGRELWRRWYTVPLKRNHGISRTVPAVDERYVVTVGPSCHVMCTDAQNGELLWGIDLVERFGTEVPLWYTGQCPLIDGSQAVIAAGGTALLVGVDLATGDVSWETPNPERYAMSHSSVMLMEVADRRTYVYAAIGAIVGISAEEGGAGDLLWSTKDFDATVIAPSPVHVGGSRIFQTAGYGAGSIMLQVEPRQSSAGGAFTVRTLYRHRPTEGLACEQQTPILYQGHLFGILPKDAGTLRGQFVCWEPEGRMVWSSGESNRFGLGPYLLADGKFYILREDGTLLVTEATVEGFRPLGSAKILDGPDPWAPMALAGGRLLARDTRQMVCVDLRAKGQKDG